MFWPTLFGLKIFRTQNFCMQTFFTKIFLKPKFRLPKLEFDTIDQVLLSLYFIGHKYWQERAVFQSGGVSGGRLAMLLVVTKNVSIATLGSILDSQQS